MFRFAIIFIVSLAGMIQAKTQSRYFRHYQVEAGLSNNTVFSIDQDSRGFVWLGTKDGLNRFDGYAFKVFRNDPDDSTSIGDNFVRSLLISTGDTLYAGTRNGIYLYDPVGETFHTLCTTTEEVRDIRKDGNGNMWYVAGKTLNRLDIRSNHIQRFDPAQYFSATSICIDAEGNVWASTTNGYLQKFDASNGTFSAFNIFNDEVQPTARWIEKIYATNGSQILAGTASFGVKTFDNKTGQWANLLTYNEDRTAIFARDFEQVNENEVWIGTESGIFIYHLSDAKVDHLQKQAGNPYALSDNAVYSLCRDKEGGIWAGTYFGGANYFPRQNLSFEKYFPGSAPASISGFAVREICEDGLGRLWIGTEDAGLNRLDKKTGTVVQYKPGGSPSNIAYPNIHGMLVRGNELLIGTFEHGLDIMDIRTGKVVQHFPGRAEELRSNFIVVMFQDRRGTIYAGTRQGLYIFDRAAGSFTIVQGLPPDCFIHAITEDSRGVLWIGTLGNGLYWIDPAKGVSGHFRHAAGNKRGIPNNSVTTLYESSRKEMWIGTEGGGLCRFVPADSSFITYSAKQGFPGNTIFRILEDDNQRLWITTSNGLVSFDPKSTKLNVYTTANGLLSNQFNYNSGYRDASGRMYFGSVKGLISFDPAQAAARQNRIPVYITGLYINDRELRPGQAGSPLKKAVSFTREVTLNHDEATFSIDFAALSFTAPEMTEYQYIMEGMDNEWTYLKTNRKVYFTNLSPGTYTFRVRAGGSENTTAITIRILPPFWASPWAYGLYAMLAVIALMLIVRGYHNRVREKTRRKIEHLEHEKEKEIYQAKIDFFTNVAHEIKTPLTLVKAPMEQIAKKAGANPVFAYDLKIMQRNTDRLVELTNQLLDFRKVETKGFQLNFAETNITELLVETYSSFKILADQKDIRLYIKLPAGAVTSWVDVDSLQKILNNLLYNALNYCRQYVEVELFAVLPGQTNFVLEVRNDGALIPANEKEKVFEPFYRLGTTQSKPGNGIGLALSRSLAILHKGSLYFREGNESMNVFVLTLPLNQ